MVLNLLQTDGWMDGKKTYQLELSDTGPSDDRQTTD